MSIKLALFAKEGTPMPGSYAQYSVCWCAGRAKWENLARLATCALICLLAMIPYAFAATEFMPVGSPGGGVFRNECPLGQFVIGARYRAGYWLDQISITCAPVDAAGMTGPQWHGATFGGNGGGPNEKSCPPGSIIQRGMVGLHPDGYVHFIDVVCRSTTSNAFGAGFRIGPEAPFFGNFYNFCPDGEAVIGIQGRAGLFVDAIGLICGAFAQVTPPPPPRPEPRPEACLQLKEDTPPDEWNDMLRAHNERRKQHCVAPLTWSNELATTAQAYAEQCILNVHGSKGENMADRFTVDGSGNPVLPAATDREAFEKTWYCEVNNYDFNNPQFKGGFTENCKDVNGHFTQVVWKNTCQLGCGRATCDITDKQGVVHKGTHWVCRYNPPGNVDINNVNVLKQQVLPAQCQ
jgi:uncharacterized protein YkwD